MFGLSVEANREKRGDDRHGENEREQAGVSRKGARDGSNQFLFNPCSPPWNQK